jgi:hypothetical protein
MNHAARAQVIARRSFFRVVPLACLLTHRHISALCGIGRIGAGE